MAGMPNSIVLRADAVLHFPEEDKRKNQEKKMKEVPKSDFQPTLFEYDLVKGMLDSNGYQQRCHRWKRC